MSQTMVFCTTDTTGKLLDELFTTSNNPEMWFLIRDLDNPPVGKLKESAPSLDPLERQQIPDVNTNFPDYSVDEIGKVYRERFAAEYDYDSAINKDDCAFRSFCVIDERGSQDKTLLLAVEFFLKPEEEREDDPVRGWRTLRVPFFAAAGTAYGIDENAFLFFDEVMAKPDGITSDGLFVLPGKESLYAEHGLQTRRN